MKYKPSLDKGFLPLILKLREFQEKVKKAEAKQTVTICLERNNNCNYHYQIDTFLDSSEHNQENVEIVERIIKSILWIVGGYKIYISGSKYIYEHIKKAYQKGGSREFDADFMETVYENKFEVVYVLEKDIPKPNIEVVSISDDLTGCRIGFDAGGSDRKVSAVIDGEVVYSEEVV